jgi:hypothetical protein
VRSVIFKLSHAPSFNGCVVKAPRAIVAVEDARWDTATSERVAGQLYARFATSGGLDAVYGMADNQASAAIRAAEAAGIAVGGNQEFGGLKTEQVKRLKDLELENSRLRKAVSDLTLDKLILEAARGNF